MDKRIILAVAGSGKTYHIANDFSDEERVILISFTNSNVNNIRKEVLSRFNGKIPFNINMMTFDSFVYNYLLKPLEPISIFRTIRSKGVDVMSTVEDDPRKNSYTKIENYKHYFNDSDKYFVSRMTKFFLNQDNSYKKIALERLRKYCDVIYFDEFQDYNGNDFKTMKYILEKSDIRISAVGDIFQSNLTPLRSKMRGTRSPFDKIDSVADLKGRISKKVNFDEKKLLKSRRVPENICTFINSNMGIKIKSSSQIVGNVIELSDLTEIHEIMIDKNIPKLIWDSRARHEVGNNYVNWTYSKGDTYPNACVILTGPTSKINEWHQIKSLKTRNALYVSLTRSEGDLYLIRDKDYKEWKKILSEQGNKY